MSEPDRLKRVDALLDGLDDVLPPPRVRAQLRLAANLTQQDVADAVGVKRLAVVRWELGKSTPGARSATPTSTCSSGSRSVSPRPLNWMRAARRRPPKGDRDDLTAIGRARQEAD